MPAYTREFYEDHREGARRSAEAIVPLVLALVRPRRVIDIGCGPGTWLAVFREHGVEHVLGVDGDGVDRCLLEIPEDRFLPWDLTKPFRLDGQFDLVVSLEVAEHLPEECAGMFVESLVALGPIVLFSAAIPHQGGTHHLNEQWPDYWATRFEEKGYVVLDWIRTEIWQNDAVEWWYAQNILMFAREEHVAAVPALRDKAARTHRSRLSLVHPKKYLEAIFEERRQRATAEITTVIPPDTAFVLVDQDEWATGDSLDGRRRIPFLERQGQYWGPPEDDATAIQELERLRRSGAGFMVFAWPAFWWLDHYGALNGYLRSTYRCLLENDRLIVFDLRRVTA